MFKVPKTLTHIDILGLRIPIVIDHERCERENASGMYDGSIILRAEYEDHEYFMKTLVHEAFHASCYTVGLQLDLQIEEVLAVTSERLFISVTKVLSEMYMEIMEKADKKEEKKIKRSKKVSK